jgi:hypothetical protein
MIIRCAKCGQDVDPTDRYWLIDKRVAHEACMTHTTDCAHTTSWAEDNKVEAAAPAVERSKRNGDR